MSYKTKKKAAGVLRGIVIFLACVVVLFPFLWMVRVSFLNKVGIFEPLNFSIAISAGDTRSQNIGKSIENSTLSARLALDTQHHISVNSSSISFQFVWLTSLPTVRLNWSIAPIVRRQGNSLSPTLIMILFIRFRF